MSGLLFAFCALIVGCPAPVGPSTTSLSAQFTKFSFGIETEYIEIRDHGIYATLPYGVDPKNLVATFTTDATKVAAGDVVQVSGVTANDYSHPVSFDLVGVDGKTTTWSVAVYIDLSTALLGFSFSNPFALSTFSGTNVSITVPSGTDRTTLVADFVVHSGIVVKVDGVVQVSGVTANDFTNPVKYAVIDTNGVTSVSTVTVSVQTSSSKALTIFGISSPSATGTISGQNITVTLPAGTALTTLAPVFSTTGTAVKIGGTVQTSGVSVVDFSGTVTYTVFASDGSSQDYFVTVTAVPQYTLTVNAGSGGSTSLSSPSLVTSGIATTLSATPSSGYLFVGWTLISGTASFGDANAATTSVTLSSGDATIQANFGQQLILNVTSSVGGSVLPSGNTNVASGASTTLQATPNSGYAFINWTSLAGTTAFDDASAPNTTVVLSGASDTVRANFGPIITTVAGNGVAAYSGDGGAATAASINGAMAAALDSSGNLYIVDTSNYRVRKVLKSTGVISTIAGTGTQGHPTSSTGTATSTPLNTAYGIIADASGNLFIADSWSSRVRKVNLTTGFISTYAGNDTNSGSSGDGGQATSAYLNDPIGVALDSSGNLYIADDGNYNVRKVTSSTGVISTFAGSGTQGNSGDGGAATSAKFGTIAGIAVDSSSNLYIVDSSNYVVRKVNSSNGIITTVVGNGSHASSGDGGAATSASLWTPTSVAVDSAGNLYIADGTRIRKVTAATGIISTVAGSGYGGDGGAATQASVQSNSVTLDSAGNLYIVGSDRIRKVVGQGGGVGP